MARPPAGSYLFEKDFLIVHFIPTDEEPAMTLDPIDSPLFEIIAMSLDLVQIITEKAEDNGRGLDSVGRVDLSWEIRVDDTR